MPVHLPPRQALAVPPFATTPCDLAESLADCGAERLLPEAEALLGDQEIFGVLQSKTRVDVGLWLWFPRLWLFVTAERLHLAAWAGPRAQRCGYVQTLTVHDDLCATYNDVTARLTLASNQPEPIPALRCQPDDGYRLLAQMTYLGFIA